MRTRLVLIEASAPVLKTRPSQAAVVVDCPPSGRQCPVSLLDVTYIHNTMKAIQYNEGNTMKQHVDINRMMGSKPKGYA